MNLRSGHPWFLEKNDPLCVYEALAHSCNADIVVLGGGITGAMMAYFLRRENLMPVIVDRRSIGCGSTAASTALLQYEADVPLFLLSEKIGEKHAVEAYRKCQQAISTLAVISRDIGYNAFEPCRSVYFAESDNKRSFLEKEFHARKKAGFDVQWLEEEQLNAEFGLHSPCAILSSNAARFDPLLFTEYLHRYNMKRGVKIYANTAVETVTHKPEHLELHTESGFTINTRSLVNATGYETLGTFDLPVTLQSTFAFASSKVTDLPAFFRNTIFWNTAQPYLYVREDEGRLIIGGGDIKGNDPEERDSQIGKKAEQLKTDFNSFFPGIDPEPECAWAGTFASTGDGLPLIGELPGLHDEYFALGFGGNGITFGAIAAELIAGILKGSGEVVPPFFRADRKIS